MFAILAYVPFQMSLASGAICPDAAVDASVLHVLYGDGKDAFYTRYGSTGVVRVNSEASTVHAAGERGPKIAVSKCAIFAAWQGDYRQGPKVWFSRSADGGKSFEPQRSLLKGTTPGLDHVAIAASGSRVAVFWLDGRGGEDADAPVTSTIWYTMSSDGGRTFGENRQISADTKVRACACCSFSVRLTTSGDATVTYRSGLRNERDIWRLSGNPAGNRWSATRISDDRWVYQGCPMDGPRTAGDATIYTIDGKVNYKAAPSSRPTVLGKGSYAGIAGDLVTWQEGNLLHWKSLKTAEEGTIPVGKSRTAVANGPDGPVIIH